MHMKNWSLIYPEQGANVNRLATAYDFCGDTRSPNIPGDATQHERSAAQKVFSAVFFVGLAVTISR